MPFAPRKYWTVYRLLCHTSNKAYIGITKRHPKIRWAQHRAQARGGRRSALAAAIRKYGPASFSLKIIAIAQTDDEAEILERKFISEFRTLTPLGYNLTAGGELRKELSREALNKMRGRKASAETRAKISAVRLGKKMNFSEEELARKAVRMRLLGLSNLGKKRGPLSEDHRRHLAEAQIIAWAQRSPPETRDPTKKKGFRKGTPPNRVFSQAAIEAARLANLGRKRVPEVTAKIVAFHTGRKRSPETCAKISLKAKERAARDPAAAAAKAAAMRSARKQKRETLK